MRGLFAAACLFLTLAPTSTRAAVLKAEYRFNGNLVSSVPGAPSLVPVDPLSLNLFNLDAVNGRTQTVYSWVGNSAPVTQQAGFTLDATGMVPTTNYSVQMAFKLTQRDSSWRRLLDVENRQSDSGFYVDPGNHLAVFPFISSLTAFVNNSYQDVLLTVNGGRVTAYLNGQQQFTGATTLMNINGSGQGSLLGFFIDNVVGGGQGEFANGSIALLRLYSGTATPAPSLSIWQSPTNSVVVYWPSPWTGWNLQVNTNLATTNWTAYGGSINDDGTTRSAIVAPPSGNQYFRLSN